MQALSTRRPIRSFVRRSGRITRSQRLALERDWPRFGIEGRGLIDLDQIFGRHAPRVMEIGFGMGDVLIEMAARDRERDYLGVEVYEPGIGRVLSRLRTLGLENVRIVRGDAVEVLATRIAERTLDAALLYFPDPWPKKRHHKRRLVQPEFAELVCSRLKVGGRFELATDWEDYARHMLGVLENTPGLVNVAGAGRFMKSATTRPMTKFERRGRRLGHDVWDLGFERRGS